MSANPHTLVVDGLNWLSRFVPCDDRQYQGAKPSVLFAEAHARVAKFARVLKRAGITALFVFDNGQTTEEANEKWLERRKREVETGVRNMPANAEGLLKALFEEHGFTILFPSGIDGDDAVARLAIKMDCHVLSRDKDMMRYGLPRGRVLSDFAIQADSIKFRVRDDRPRVAGRDVSQIPCDIQDWKPKGSTLKINALEGKLRRGNADGHTRTLGNLNATVRPLRAALYARLGIASVEEHLPAWKNGAFAMDVTVVHPDPAHDSLLDDPLAMLTWITCNANGAQFEDRKHAAAMAAAEIHDAASEPDARTSAMRIYDEYTALLPLASIPGDVSHGWCAFGPCYGLRGKSCFGNGRCYPTQLDHAALIGKDPLCMSCCAKLQEILEASRLRKQLQGTRIY